MSKDTPEIWRLDTEDVDLPDHVGISTDDHSLFAQVVWKMEDDDATPECEARVHLMLSAPDLLKALEDIVNSAKAGTAVVYHPLIDVAEAAIAKARGKV